MKTIEQVIDDFLRAPPQKSSKKLLETNDVALDEEEQQIHLASKNSKDDEKQSASAKPDAEQTKIDDKKIEGIPSADDIAEKLNAIRSGRSLRDSGVKDRFERYVEDLDDNEKRALFTFLKGIGQIITGGVEPETALEPHDPPAKIHMHRKKIQQVKKKPQVTKKPVTGDDDKKVAKPGEEDTEPPKPVKLVK